MVTVNYGVRVTNTGVQHDVICGFSLIDAAGLEYPLRWFVVWDVPTGESVTFTDSFALEIPAGTYTAICRAWTSYEPGIVLATFPIGVIYKEGTGAPLPPWLDEAKKTLVIAAPAVSAQIDEFSITV